MEPLRGLRPKNETPDPAAVSVPRDGGGLPKSERRFVLSVMWSFGYGVVVVVQVSVASQKKGLYSVKIEFRTKVTHKNGTEDACFIWN